jgi:hypothetical protein
MSNHTKEKASEHETAASRPKRPQGAVAEMPGAVFDSWSGGDETPPAASPKTRMRAAARGAGPRDPRPQAPPGFAHPPAPPISPATKPARRRTIGRTGSIARQAAAPPPATDFL